MNNELKDVTEIKNFEDESKKDLSYTFPKYQYKIFIKDGPVNKEKKILKNNIKQKLL